MMSFEHGSPATFESPERKEKGTESEREERALKLIHEKFPGREVGYIMEDPSDGAILFGEPSKTMEPKTIYRVLLAAEGGESSVQVLDILENDQQGGVELGAV